MLAMFEDFNVLLAYLGGCKNNETLEKQCEVFEKTTTLILK